MGPYNPSGKSALVAVTRNGTLRLLLQGADSRWQDASAEIESTLTSADVLTHAAFCGDKGKGCSKYSVTFVNKQLADNTLLLVVHTTGKQLQLFRINFEWSPANTKQQDSSIPLNSAPVIHVQHVKVEGMCSPLSATQDVNDPSLGTSRGFLPPAQLSHLDMLPPGPETRNREPTYPTIIAVFTHVPNQYDKSQFHEDAYSILARWELYNTKSSLHPAFDQLAAKKTHAASVADLAVRMPPLLSGAPMY